MRIGSEYRTSNTEISFPLSDNQETELPEQVRKAIVDARFVIAPGDALPTLEELYLDDGVCYAVISGLSEPLESDLDTPGFNVVRSGLCCIVFDNTYLNTQSDFDFSGPWIFDIKCTDIDVNKVTSLTLVNTVAGQRESISVAPGEVSFHHGYSTTVSNNDGVVINAIPGAGKGFYQCGCEDDQQGDQDTDDDVIKLYTKSGILKIQNDTCYDIIPDINDELVVYPSPVGTVLSKSVRLVNKCTPCCTCQQYVNKVDRLRTLAGKVSSSGAKIIKAKNDLNTAIGTFNGNSSIHTGGVSPGWFAALTALKKNPSVGSIRGNLHIRAVATVSNTTLCKGRMNISEFSCTSDGTTYSFDGNNCNWFMIGQNRTSVGLPPSDLLVDPGKTVNITGTITIPGSPNTITVKISGTGTVDDTSAYSCDDGEFEEETIC